MATNFRTLIPMLNLLLLFFFSIPCYSATDTITQGQQIRDWEQLNSANNLFRLQFFGPTTSKLRYLGIFYNIPPPTYEGIYGGDDKAVWVANRNNPIPDASGNLMIDVDGKLKIFYAGNNAVSVFDSLPATGNITATLLNNGNLVLRELETDGSVKQVLWQSFDYPTDTLLPGMKLGINHRTGHVWSLTSWISDELPASGSFTLGLDPNVTNQLNIWWRGNISWTSGPWRNNRFANAARLSVYDGYNFTYVSNEDEIYFTYSVRYRNGSHPRYTIDQDGNLSEEKGARPPFGCCFPAHVADTGCVEQNLPECRRKYYWFFIQRQGIIYGDGFRFDESMNYSLFDCEAFCTNDCSCVAYASTSYNKTGCQIWRKGLRFQATTNSLDHAYMFVQDKDNNWFIWLCLGLGIFVILLAISICCIVRRCKRRRKNKKRLGLNLTASSKYSSINNQESDQTMGDNVHLFSYETIAAATNNFSSMNKLGEGGFGPVYKGKLPDGQEVAIKRLSSSSGQGVVEFKNEILLIAKLQHTNLVRLLGSCIKGDEKILVYEYMPNKSLDFFLFDSSKSGLLNWTDRFKIIEGIAQGLLYLHKYSRLRIIHRDLKASNILLDDYLNPKISDFGMARIFGINQDEANTNRVVGTYGYMSPEYAIKGIVSLKTDVFSYGVLLLEIVSGKKNNSCFNLQHPLNLIGLAWKLWKEDRGLELMDPTLGDSYPQNEAMRCIQVGLLCVQDQADDRPSMSDVVSMLTNETKEVRAPKQPAFFIETDKLEAAAVERFESSSTNEITISVMEPR